jgi:hypothetical protein
MRYQYTVNIPKPMTSQSNGSKKQTSGSMISNV